jgi:putative PEP-CTERM system histidine kinase
MNFSTWVSLAAFQVAAIAGGMACILALRKQTTSSHRSLAALLGVTALANLANGVGMLDEARALFWREIAMVAEVAQPAALLYVGLAFLNPAERRANSSMLWPARITGFVGLLLAVLAVTGQVFHLKTFQDGQAAIGLAAWGRITYVFVVIGMALGLAQLELVLVASREPIRHKLKFIVIGLGGLAGYHIYQASQMLLFPVWHAGHVLVASVVTAVALGLVAFGLARTRLREVFVNTYISQEALFGSISFVVIGLYLMGVGAVGEWLRRTDQPLGVGLSIVVVFGALVGLAIAAFSNRVRAKIRRVIARNFYRSKYDYRAKWLEVTKAFQQVTSKEEIMDRLLDLLIKTFQSTTISIWSFRQADQRFSRIRSMTAEKEPNPLDLLDLSHPVIMQLLKNDEPALIQECLRMRNGDVGSSRDPLSDSGAVLCFPIRTQGHLTAFVALGKPLHGEAYGTDDCDLLNGISHHVGALLSHANLAEERQASAELEALHRFSVFCLHDLKNLAARLSLIAQNVKNHGQDQAFQESAMRTVSDTAEKITALVSKLSLKSVKPTLAGAPESVEISALIEEVVAPMRGEGMVRFHVTGGPVQPILGVRDQIHQVLLNVILNARQAIGQNGDISVKIEQLNGSVVVTVDDTGGGIPSPMLDSLFRPSQSSRPGGLGVGLYQCKQILQANRGTIQIRSEVGKGTQVRIELPLVRASDIREDNVMAYSTMP